MENLYKNLAKVKSEVGKISKDSTNPFFKAKYFDINALLQHVEPIIQKNGLMLLQPLKIGQVSTLIVDVESGESIESVIVLPELTDPQKLGSCITYYRRYTLQSLLGLQAEDDDGNKASGNGAKKDDEEDNKAWITVGDKAWMKAIEKGLTVKDLREFYKVSKANAAAYEAALNN